MNRITEWGMEIGLVMFIVAILVAAALNAREMTVVSFCDNKDEIEFRITHNGSSAQIPQMIPFSESSFCSE
ncbi:MAG: hypothetical protein GY757_19025 [bacterium]|nr:hypothetical protein [bacterium]